MTEIFSLAWSHIWGTSWGHRFELIAEILTLASVWFIWLPAKRMTDRIRGATVAGDVPPDLGVLSVMAKKQRKWFYRQLLRWEARDSGQLRLGLLLGIAASAIKVILMCAAEG
jgi:hypothetical protein